MGGTTVNATNPTAITPEVGDQFHGLPRLVLEARARLGPDATPEAVADDLRARGVPDVGVDEVRQLWDEGHLPA
jgi:hypothetical protein